MSLNLITGSGSRARAYSPDRDLAHNFGSIFQHVCHLLQEKHGYWKPIQEYIKAKQVDGEQLAKGLKALQTFITTAAQYPSETIADVAKRSGWDEVTGPAQMAIMAVLGGVMCGAYFSCVRDATLGSLDPVDNQGDMINACDKAAAILSGKYRS